jgi:DNA-binding response OmpR family regulator
MNDETNQANAVQHILVVDDESQVRTMLQMFLRRSGFEVSEAADGEEALKILSSTAVDLVVLDLIMPGKEGLETLMAIRKKGADPKVVVVSGGAKSVDTDFLPVARKLGANATLKKPFRNEDLLRTIEGLL